MIRRIYKKKNGKLSNSNEPENSLIFNNINVREYPDMQFAYFTIAAFFGIQQKNFILGNGCENVLKNVLLALNVKRLYWSTPAWGFLDVYCEQLKIEKINSEFVKVGNTNAFTDDCMSSKLKVKKDAFSYYCTEKSNNLVLTKKCKSLEKLAQHTIVDCSYLRPKELIEKIQSIKCQPARSIVLVGSFDKMFGCGLRLGFAVCFNETLIKHIQLQRENFINAVAYEFILEHKFDSQISHEYANRLRSQFPDCIVTDNFITIPVRNSNLKCKLPHKCFSVQTQPYVRFGIPTTNDNYLELIQSIQNVKSEQCF